MIKTFEELYTEINEVRTYLSDSPYFLELSKKLTREWKKKNKEHKDLLNQMYVLIASNVENLDYYEDILNRINARPPLKNELIKEIYKVRNEYDDSSFPPHEQDPTKYFMGKSRESEFNPHYTMAQNNKMEKAIRKYGENYEQYRRKYSGLPKLYIQKYINLCSPEVSDFEAMNIIHAEYHALPFGERRRLHDADDEEN